MNDAYALNRENLLRTLPHVLAEDPHMLALATVIADVLAARSAEIDRLSIYPNIDYLPENLLDILAHDFKVDWWNFDYSLEEKRKTLRDSWNVHRHLGTPYAVTTALSAIYPHTSVQEWFEYNGKPYHFRLQLSLDGEEFDPVKHKEVKKRVRFYKNLRSWLDVIEYKMPLIVFLNSPGLLYLKSVCAYWFQFQNFGPVILLNGRKTLDGSWILGHVFKMMQLNRLSLALRMIERELLTCSLVFPGIPFRFKEQVPCRQIHFFMTSPFQSLGPAVLLDGRKTLNGTWSLKHVLRRKYLQKLLLSSRIPERERLTCSLAPGRLFAHTGEQTSFQKFAVSFSAKNAQNTALPAFQCATKIQQPFRSMTASLTRNSLWKLDGSFSLNGSKRLNASISKEEF